MWWVFLVIESETTSHSVISVSLWPNGLYSPWNSAGQNTGVDSLSHLQWIFLTQEFKWGLLHSRCIFFVNWAMREALLAIRELKCIEITEQQPQSRNTTIIQYKGKYTKFYLSRQTPFIWLEKCNSFHLASKTWFLAYADTDNSFKHCAGDGRWEKWFIMCNFLTWRARNV